MPGHARTDAAPPRPWVQAATAQGRAMSSMTTDSEWCFTVSWLRVFRSAHTTHRGQGVGQEKEPSVGPSEQYTAR
jgi:hypothetical protein